MNRKAVRKKKSFALGEIRCDVLFIHCRNDGVGSRDKNHISSFHRIGRVHDFEAKLLGHLAGLRLLVKTDDDIKSAVLEVQRVGVALRAEADHGESFLFERSDRRILGGIDFRSHGRL